MAKRSKKEESIVEEISVFNCKSKDKQNTQFRIIWDNFRDFPIELQCKWMNFIRSRKSPQESKNVHYPTTLILELANTCNFDCPMCRMGQFGWDSSKIMPLDFFTRIANELQKKLSDPDFQRILKSLSDETYLSYCEYLQKTNLNQIQTDYMMNVTIRKQINYKIHQRQMLKMIKESLFGMI